MIYSELKALIIEYTHRDDLEGNALLDRFIDLAAIRIGRDCRLMEMERTATLTVDDFVGLPRDYAGMRSVTIPTAHGDRQLEPISPAQYAKPGSRQNGLESYTIKNGQIHIGALADVTLNYYRRPPELVNDSDTNYTLDRYPNLYLYGTLIEVWMWAQDGDAYNFVKAQFNEEVEAANAQADRQRFGSGSAIKRVDK